MQLSLLIIPAMFQTGCIILDLGQQMYNIFLQSDFLIGMLAR